MFKRVIGKRCSRVAFKSCDVIVVNSLDACNQCGGPLEPVSAINKKTVAALILPVVILVGIISYLIVGITSSPVVKPLAQTEQKQPQPPEPARPSPRSDVNETMTRLFRSVYSDGKKTEEEQKQIDRLAREQAIDPNFLARQEQEIKAHLNKSQNSLKQAMVFAGRQDYVQALKELKRSIEIYPENAFAWANLAAVCLNLNDREQAQAACNKAIALDPHNWLAHYNLGSLYVNRGEKDLAIQELSEALRLVNEDEAQRITKAEVTDLMRTDQSLGPLRNDPRFQQLLARY